MKRLGLCFWIILLCSNVINAQTDFEQNTRVLTQDISLVIGDWQGELTYLDYQSGKPFSMPANVRIAQGKDSRTLNVEMEYPNEPQANNSAKIKINKDGSEIDGYAVNTRNVDDSGNVTIEAEKWGKDDNKKALIRMTYTFGNAMFAMSKSVQFEGSDAWILRNTYEYQRSK